MTTLISKNEEKGLDLDMVGHLLPNGDTILVGPLEEIEKAKNFLAENGFGGLYFLYFNPEGEVEKFDEFEFLCTARDMVYGIRFFNTQTENSEGA